MYITEEYISCEEMSRDVLDFFYVIYTSIENIVLLDAINEMDLLCLNY